MALFKNIEQVRDFLAWCKSEQIRAVEIDGVKAQFSEAALAPGERPKWPEEPPGKKPEPDRSGYTADELY